MRYLAPGCEDFDRTYFVHDGPATIRPGTWGDLAPVSSLYNQRQPDWFIKDYPRRVFRDIRYEGHYRRVWLPTQERQGTALVLENRRQRVVGIASTVAVDSYVEQHTHVVDCWACPAYVGQLPELLSAVVARARAAGAEALQAYLAKVIAASSKSSRRPALARSPGCVTASAMMRSRRDARTCSSTLRRWAKARRQRTPSRGSTARGRLFSRGAEAPPSSPTDGPKPHG